MNINKAITRCCVKTKRRSQQGLTVVFHTVKGIQPRPCQSSEYRSARPGAASAGVPVCSYSSPARLVLRSPVSPDLGPSILMQLSKQSGYAVRIVVDCAKSEDDLVQIADIARRNGITMYNVAKVVPILARQGIIETVRGRGGGIRLARPASQITVGEIVRASEATRVATDPAAMPGNGSPLSAATFGRMLDDALDAFISVLDQHTVAELIAGQSTFEGIAADDTETGERNADQQATPVERGSTDAC